VLQNQTGKEVDVEFLLETIEKFEKSEREVLLDFYLYKKSILPPLGNSHLSEQIKQFIRDKCFISATKTTYLQPLLHFIDEYKLIDNFSTNYDNSVEQFCDRYDISYVDGFDRHNWNPETFKKLNHGIRLHKLHGSITWVRPVSFAKENKAMLGNCKMILESGLIAIDPCFDKLIVSLRTAQVQ